MKQAYIEYILGLLLFGSNGVISGMIALNSYEIVLTRTVLGSAFLILLLQISRQKLQIFRYKKEIPYMLLSGVALAANWMFLFEGYTQVGVSITILLCYCGPILVMLVSPFFFNERITAPKIIGFCAAMMGMVFINGQSLQAGKSLWGIFCGVMAAVTYVFMVISNKKATHITGLENSTIQILISFIAVAVFVVCKQGFTLHIQSSDWIPILVLGILNTGIGMYLYFSPISKLPVQSVAICGYLEPLSAVIFSVLFLHEEMLPLYIIGGILIISGALFGEFFQFRQEEKSSGTPV
ncbi:MAG: DMT family transporter [Clostridia bacterium]